ncbi:hypothetical protein LWC33_28625 [Pseudonocardia sp. RS11V-5]|uniref:hypothetical protein n=1 Tax=Pseudonocardia terrae TaxID=2905831 RepID=UPI001E54E72A|nr:hypothetical protein [Pseudonocardia terrae]MCE3555398.1 hypothetical protein [Pseudonocardia terrae]
MRTCPMTVAAATPCPTTSPITKAVAPDPEPDPEPDAGPDAGPGPRRMTSNQSPPIFGPVAAGR